MNRLSWRPNCAHIGSGEYRRPSTNRSAVTIRAPKNAIRPIHPGARKREKRVGQERASAEKGRLDGQRGLLRHISWPDAKDLADLHRLVPVRGHRFLSGVLDPARLTPVERLLFRAVGGRYGDEAGRDDVDAWADEIARELRTARPRPGAPSGTPSRTFAPARRPVPSP